MRFGALQWQTLNRSPYQLMCATLLWWQQDGATESLLTLFHNINLVSEHTHKEIIRQNCSLHIEVIATMVEFPPQWVFHPLPAGCQNLLTLQNNKHLDASHCYKLEETVDSSFNIISDQHEYSLVYGFPKKVDGSIELEMISMVSSQLFH